MSAPNPLLKLVLPIFLSASFLVYVACGPGLGTLPADASSAPSVAITTPTGGVSASSFVTYTGTCTTGLGISISTPSATLVPTTTATCSDGTFSFTEVFSAITGSYPITVSQTNAAGLSDSSTVTLSYSYPTFFPFQGGFDQAVDVSSLMSDGTLLVGGQFQTYRGTTAGGIARLNADGSSATNFTSSGTGFPGGSIINAFYVDGSSNIYVGGTFNSYNGTSATNFIKLSPSGAASNFIVGTGFSGGSVYAIATTAAPDVTGDIYVGGSFTSFSGTTIGGGIARLATTGMSAGSLSATFPTSTAFNGTVYAIAAVSGSTDVLVGGGFTELNLVVGSAPKIARLTNAGTIAASASFAAGGAGFNDTVDAILPAQDGTGDFFVAGNFTTYQPPGVATTTYSSPGLIRLTNTLQVRTTFSVGSGFTGTLATSGAMMVTTLAFDNSTGGLVVAGNFTTYEGLAAPGITRLNPSTASPDPNFTGTNSPWVGFNGQVSTVSIDSSGNIYAGGEFTSYQGTTTVPHIAQLSNTALLTPAYNSGARVSGGSILTVAPTLDYSGDVYIGGNFTAYQGTPVAGIARVTQSGALNTSFSSGIAITSGSVSSIVNAGDGTGDIFVGGNFVGTGSYLVRVSSTGELRTPSTTPAFTTPPFAASPSILALAVSKDTNKELFVGGSFTLSTSPANPANNLIKITMAGAIDKGFDVGTGFTGGPVRAIAVTGGNGVWAGGDFTTYTTTTTINTANYLALVNSDGTFGAAVSGLNGSVYALVMAPDTTGEVYAAGAFTSPTQRIARITTGGVVTNSTFNVTDSAFDDTVYSLAVAQDGTTDIFAFGVFQNFQGSNAFGLARLTQKGVLNSLLGVLNPGFSAVGVPETVFPATDGSGSLYLSGSDYLVRLDSAGNQD